MKRKIKQISLMTVFLLAFVILAAMGSKNVEAKIVVWDSQEVPTDKNVGDNLIQIEIVVEEGEYKSFMGVIQGAEGQSVAQYLEVRCIEINTDKIIEASNHSSGWNFNSSYYKFPNPGDYIYEIRLKEKPKTGIPYSFTYSVDTNKFSSMTAKKVQWSNGSFSVDLELGTLDSSVFGDNDNTVFYRLNTSTNELKCIKNGRGDTADDTSVDFATTYIYYAVKEPIVKEKMPSLIRTEATTQKLSTTMKKSLEKIANSTSFTTPAPGVGSAVSLKATPGIKSANLEWRGSTKSDVSYITGYQIKRYNSAGKNDATYTVKDSGQYSNVLKCTIPYEGTYYFTAKPYYTYKGKTYWGAETGKVGCASAKIYSPTCLATKISNKVAKVTVNVPEGANGTIIYQNVGGKWKEIGKTSYSKKYTVKKNTAGKRQYRLVSYVTDAGKTYYAAPGKAAKPQTNVCNCNYPKYAGGYKSASHFWRPIKISYSGNKVVVKGRFINTHIYRMDFFNIKLTVKAEGKVIGTKTIKCGRIKSKGTKVVTVKLDKSKKNMDLRNGNLYWSYKVIRADAFN